MRVKAEAQRADSQQRQHQEFARADVGQLLDMYNTALQKYNQASTAQDYSTQESLIRKQYETSMENMASSYPQLAPVVSAVFHDALSATAQGLGS